MQKGQIRHILHTMKHFTRSETDAGQGCFHQSDMCSNKLAVDSLRHRQKRYSALCCDCLLQHLSCRINCRNCDPQEPTYINNITILVLQRCRGRWNTPFSVLCRHNQNISNVFDHSFQPCTLLISHPDWSANGVNKRRNHPVRVQALPQTRFITSYRCNVMLYHRIYDALMTGTELVWVYATWQEE